MTALFFDLGIAKSNRIPGFPLDGLPPLEAGGTLGGAFAEALGTATAGSDADGEAAPVEGDGGDDAAPDGTDPEALAGTADALPVTIAIPATPEAAATKTSDSGTATTLPAADGKTLPVAGPDIAVALPITPKEGDGTAKAQATPQDGATQPLALLAMRGLAMPAPSTPGAAGAAPTATDQAGTAGPAARTAGTAGSATAFDPTALAAKGEEGSTPGEGKGDGKSDGRGDGVRRGDAQGEVSARLATKLASASGKGDSDSAQQGFSVNVRAAERAGASADLSQAGLPSTTGTAPVAGALPGMTTHGLQGGSAATSGTMPGFPELAALVDRIAAARDSAGSASATVSLAHKELGNLSLTFETSGRTLDVEVSAQDNETQRSLAAALAADRPHVRAADAQTPTQQQHQGNAQGGTATQSGQADARQSGAAGDSPSERRDNPRHASPDGGARAGSGQPGSGPKSDGGIYA